jgi:hypothetical protein
MESSLDPVFIYYFLADAISSLDYTECFWNRRLYIRYVIYGPKQRRTFTQTCIIWRFILRDNHLKYQVIRNISKAASYLTERGGHFGHLLWRLACVLCELEGGNNSTIILGPLLLVYEMCFLCVLMSKVVIMEMSSVSGHTFMWNFPPCFRP